VIGRWDNEVIILDCHVAGSASIEPERKIVGRVLV